MEGWKGLTPENSSLLCFPLCFPCRLFPPLSVPGPLSLLSRALMLLFPPHSLSSRYLPLAVPTSTLINVSLTQLASLCLFGGAFLSRFLLTHSFVLTVSPHPHLVHRLFQPLFFTLPFSVGLSHPLPCTFTGTEEIGRCPLPTKCIFQWGFGNVNTPRQAQTVECVMCRRNTKNVTKWVRVTSSSAWGRELHGGECKYKG